MRFIEFFNNKKDENVLGFNTADIRKLVRKEDDSVVISKKTIAGFFLILTIIAGFGVYAYLGKAEVPEMILKTENSLSEISDIDEFIINKTKVSVMSREEIDGEVTYNIPEYYNEFFEELRNGLKLLPDELKRDFVDCGGYINIEAKENLKGRTDIALVERGGVKKIQSVVIYLTPTVSDIEESIIHEFGHFAAYDMFKAPYSDDAIPNYEDDVDRFINDYCNGNYYYSDKAEYFAEIFEYSVLISKEDQAYKDAEIISNYTLDFYGD